MQALVLMVQVETVFCALCGLVILWMQVRGFLKHGRKFFLTLANSTIFAFVGMGLTAYPYFVPVSEAESIELFKLSVPIYVLATVLATWGGVQFFRAYDEK